MKASQARAPIYDAIKAIAGRDLTDDEHKKIRRLLIEYVDSQMAPTKDIIIRQANKIHRQGQVLYTIGKKHAMPEKLIKQLIEAPETYGKSEEREDSEERG